MKNYADYILLATRCPDCSHECRGVTTTLTATTDGHFFLENSSPCADELSVMEITEDIFNSLIQAYIAAYGKSPVTP